MKTLLKDLLQADWAPTMEASARALVMAVAIPAAIALVLGQWLLFTWRRPLAGVLALVPVRKTDPVDAISVATLTRSIPGRIGADETMDEVLADAADFADFAAELGSMSSRMDFGMARPTLPAAPLPPALAPAPRRQRRDSKRPQAPA